MPISLCHLIVQMNLDGITLTVYANKFMSFDCTNELRWHNVDSLCQ
jgi:hypothetical protein